MSKDLTNSSTHPFFYGYEGSALMDFPDGPISIALATYGLQNVLQGVDAMRELMEQTIAEEGEDSENSRLYISNFSILKRTPGAYALDILVNLPEFAKTVISEEEYENVREKYL